MLEVIPTLQRVAHGHFSRVPARLHRGLKGSYLLLGSSIEFHLIMHSGFITFRGHTLQWNVKKRRCHGRDADLHQSQKLEHWLIYMNIIAV